jgi:hypothetical protein
MSDTRSQLEPPDEVSEVSSGEMLREVLVFAAIIGALAGIGYGLFAGYSDWAHATEIGEKSNVLMIAVWGVIWGLGGAIGVPLVCGLLASIFLGVVGLVRRLARG